MMQVTELSAEGLKREYKVVVAADEIEEQVQGRLQRLSKTIRLPGFRPGKAPISLLRKQHGRAIMGEVLQEAVNKGSEQALSDNSLKPALQPKVEVTSFDEGSDLEFSLALEVLPDVPNVDCAAIELTRLVCDVDDKSVDDALQRLAEGQRDFKAPEEQRASQEGDRVIIDFVGRIDGETFDGGTADDFPLVLGSGAMIPGFEDQLSGVEAGTDLEVTVTFPEEFPNKELAGREAVFATKVKEVLEPQPIVIDDALADKAGMENLEALRTAVRERIESEYAGASRSRLKRMLLDALAEQYVFDVPTGMIDLEFDAIWKQLQSEMERSGTSYEEAGKSEEELTEEYRAIAERRVRLGLILSDIGTKNDLKVEAAELNSAVMAQARRYPGQERQVVEYFQNNTQAVDQLRAPLFEDKVVDFVLQICKVEEQKVAVEELMRDPDDDDGENAKSDSAKD